jgi:hypothetical protein
MFLTIVSWIVFIPTAILSPVALLASLTLNKPNWVKILLVLTLFMTSGYYLFP